MKRYRPTGIRWDLRPRWLISSGPDRERALGFPRGADRDGRAGQTVRKTKPSHRQGRLDFPVEPDRGRGTGRSAVRHLQIQTLPCLPPANAPRINVDEAVAVVAAAADLKPLGVIGDEADGNVQNEEIHRPTSHDALAQDPDASSECLPF